MMVNKRILKKYLLPLWFITFFVLASTMEIHAQEESENEMEADSSSEDKTEDILKYGIDNEVISVLDKLKSDKDDSYNDLLTEVFSESRNISIEQEIVRLWNDTQYEEGLPLAHDEIRKVIEDEDYSKPVVGTCLSFIAMMKYEEAIPELIILANHRDDEIAAAAVRAIGSVGTGEDTSLAGTLLERLIKEDPIANEDLVAALIVTLGNIRYEPAAGELVLIAEDEGASTGHRRLACVSIGKIGREEDFQSVERLYYESEDALLRAYALAGLAEFNEKDTSEVLIRALKRDSFWRIRVTAAEHLTDVSGDEVDELLRYKAENDPVTQVKTAALKTLGARSGSQNNHFLTDFFSDSKRSIELRIACLNVLLENKTTGTVNAVKDVLDEEWEAPGRFLEFVCRELSGAEWDALAPLYEKMLHHENWLIPVYGIRGIRKNSIQSLEGKIAALDAEGVDGRVRREVTDGD